jgi:putative transposase
MLNSRLQIDAYVLNYKFRLYPKREQETRLVDLLEVNRIVYNYFVLNNFRTRNDMNYALTELKERQPALRKYHSKMLQMISTRVVGAWTALDEKKKRGYKTGKLRLLERGECNSFTYNQSGFQIRNDRLYLSKIGRIEIRLHRQPVDVKQVTIVRQAGRWYAIAACAVIRRIASIIVYKRQ